MKKSSKSKRAKIKDIDGKFEMGNSISACDCTGLIQVEPLDEYELQSYLDVYDFGPFERD